MTFYERKAFEWFVKATPTLSELKKLCKKHFKTEDVDILDEFKVLEMYEKEKKV